MKDIEKYFTNKRILVSHFAQVPCKPFNVEVTNELEALRLVEILAKQHLFLFENNIIPDFANIISVSIWNEEVKEDDNDEFKIKIEDESLVIKENGINFAPEQETKQVEENENKLPKKTKTT